MLRDVSFTIGRGESYGLVGESGCGKSTVALAVDALPGRATAAVERRVDHDRRAGRAGDAGEAELRELRADTVSMVYQDPGKALNPSIRVGRQVAEVFELGGLGKGEARDRAAARCSRRCRSPIPAG